jgi:hypothetical protein
MASVNFRGIYLSRVTDLSDVLRLNATVGLSEARSIPGSFRRGANGRTRLIRRAGLDRSMSVSIGRADRTVRAVLEQWAGELLLLRDGRGRKVYGSYLSPQFAEKPGLPFTAISLTFVELSYDESV